jgi:integrase
MKIKRYQLKKEKYLTEPEYEKLHKRLDELKGVEPRNCAMIFTAMYTGARAQEILNLRPTDLDPNENTVYVRGIKGSDDREITLPDWLFELLVQVTGEKHIFEITYPRLDQIWRSFRTTAKKFHSLRHTFAIRLYKATKDIRLVQVCLGHRQISNTMIYAAYLYNTEETRKAVKLIWRGAG